MTCCTPIVITQVCPVCGAPMRKVYDEYYGCSADEDRAIAWMKAHPDEYHNVEPVHSFACLGMEDNDLHFQGSFEYNLNQLWHIMDDEDQWPPRKVGHVVI